MASFVDSESDVTDIRSPLNIASLERFLDEKSNQCTTLGAEDVWPKLRLPLTVKQFKFGQSNPTYLLTDSNGRHAVLRRKPTSNVKLISKSAHAIEREFLILRGIGISNNENKKFPNSNLVPIPEVYVLCEDESVLGYVFYIMEFVKGRIFQSPTFPGVPELEKEVYWKVAIKTIASVHSLNAEKLAEELPRSHFPTTSSSSVTKTGFFERQIKTLNRISVKQGETVSKIPYFEEICHWLTFKSPADPKRKMLIHGDFKIDNVIFHPTEPRILAILDWELCTFGHPLFDLANLLQPLSLPATFNRRVMKDSNARIGKEYTSPNQIDKLLDYYVSFNDMGESNNPKCYWKAGFIFGLLRLSVISQGIAMRLEKGEASSSEAKVYSKLYFFLAEIAKNELSGHSKF